MNWTAYPLVRLAILFVFGMAMADFFVGFIEWDRRVLLALLSVALIVMGLSFRIKQKKSTAPVFGIATAIFCFLFGMTLYIEKCERVKVRVEDNVSFLRGTLEDFPVSHRKTLGLNVKRNDGRIFHLYVPKRDSVVVSELHLGDTIMARPLHVKSTCLHDANMARTKEGDSSFSWYSDYLFYNGISATCYAPSGSYCFVRSDSELSLVARLRYIGKHAVKLYDEAGMDGEGAAIVEAMTIGEKSGLSKSLKDSYSHAGVSHVLALSGFHLTVIYFLLNILLLGRVTIRKWRWISRIVIILFVWAFTIMSGMPPSLVRSALMCSIMLLSSVFGLSGTSLASCAFAALVMLVFNPLMLMDVGFRLSFISVVGICLVGVPLSFVFNTRNMLLNSVWGTISITIACTLFTAPLVAYHFGYFSLCSLFSNLLVSLFATAILAVSAVWWIVYPMAEVRGVLTNALEWIAEMMNSIVKWFASFDYAVVEWHPYLVEVVLFYIAVVFLVHFAYKRKSRQLVWGLSAFVCQLAFAAFRNLF